MNFNTGEINIIIAALRFAGMSYAEMSKDNATLIGKRQEAENQGQFARGAFALAERLERDARSAGITIHRTSN